MVTAATLSGIEIFGSLSTDDREALAANCDSHSYAAEQQIISYSDNSTDVYFIVSGAVRATIYSTSGKEVTFRDLEAGQLFGDMSAIDGKPRSATVVTLTDSLIVSMPADIYWDALMRYPEICGAESLKNLTSLIRLLCDRVVEFSTMGVKKRIYAELLRLATRQTQDNNSAAISPAPTHAEIASLVSTHREAVTREMSHLTQTGLIERRSGTLVICDVTELARMVRGLDDQ